MFVFFFVWPSFVLAGHCFFITILLVVGPLTLVGTGRGRVKNIFKEVICLCQTLKQFLKCHWGFNFVYYWIWNVGTISFTGFKRRTPYFSSTSTCHKRVRPEPFCFPSCFCSLLMWPFDEGLHNWVEMHWCPSLRPRSIWGGGCILKDAGATIDNGSGFYVHRFLKNWVVAWQTFNNIFTHTHTECQCLPWLCWMLATCWFTDAVDRSCKVAQRRKYRTCCKLFLHSSVLNRSYSWLKNCESSLEPFIWKFSECGEDTVTANFPDPKHLHQCTNCHCGLRCSRQVLHPVLGRCRHFGSICHVQWWIMSQLRSQRCDLTWQGLELGMVLLKEKYRVWSRWIWNLHWRFTELNSDVFLRGKKGHVGYMALPSTFEGPWRKPKNGWKAGQERFVDGMQGIVQLTGGHFLISWSIAQDESLKSIGISFSLNCCLQLVQLFNLHVKSRQSTVLMCFFVRNEMAKKHCQAVRVWKNSFFTVWFSGALDALATLKPPSSSAQAGLLS